GNYYYNNNNGMTINNGKTLYVQSGVNVLYVPGGFTGKPGSTITIASGAILKLYVGDATGSSVSASFDQLNNGGNANSFQFYGLPTCTGLSLGGNGQFMGTVYAPEAQLTFNGGGNNTLDFQGACVIGSASLNGHFHIHYDVNLSRNGPVGGYTLASWLEL